MDSITYVKKKVFGKDKGKPGSAIMVNLSQKSGWEQNTKSDSSSSEKQKKIKYFFNIYKLIYIKLHAHYKISLVSKM